MRITKLFLILILTFAAGCAKTEDLHSVTDMVNAAETPSGLVRTYVETNAFIDVDVPSITYGLANPSSRSSNVNIDDVAKMKAAVYRFYKNVSVENGFYSCSLSNGTEINISEDVFKALLDNLKDMNSFIEECMNKGEVVHITEPTEEYLNSLLN